MTCKRSRALTISVLVAMVFIVNPLIAEDQSTESEPKQWADTGWMYWTVIQPSTEGRVSPEHYGDVDQSTLEQLASRRQRLETLPHHPPGPGLKWVEPVEDAEPTGRPTDVWSGRAAGDFVLDTNTEPSSVAPGGFSSTVNEPSTVSAGATVLYTGNWYAALSTDGGQTFNFVNPFNSPFAATGDGFCCDQTTVYDPVSNTIIWLQQYLEDGSSGVQRLNIDQGADGAFDCFYDITPQDVGFPNQNWFDYPDMALSDTYLYHSSNVFSTPGYSFTGAVVARYPLSVLSTCSAISVESYTDGSFGSFRLSRGAAGTMYFASHISNSSLRIWSWPDGAGSPSSADRSITSWSNTTRSCTGPDGRDWCGFIDSRLQGAWVADGVVGFMWVPAQGGSYAYPYTRIARFSEAGLTLVGEPEIYSSEVAWVYPSVDVNANSDLGGSIMFGGASDYTSCAMWLADDVNSDTIQPLEYQIAATGTSGPSSNRSGDYNVSRVSSPSDLTYSGACFTYPSTSAGEARYTWFGREASFDGIFTDGFEAGNTTAWDGTTP